MPPRALGLWHLALNVRDLPPMERFYTDIMKMAVEWRPDPDNVYLSSGLDNLALHRQEGLPPVGTLSILDHLGFFVRNHEEVDAWYTFIQEAKITTDTAPRTHRDGARSFYFRDPEENRIQLICHPPVNTALASFGGGLPSNGGADSTEG